MHPQGRAGFITILFASVLALTFAMNFTAPANGQDASSLSVEQQLADKYAPYMSLKKEKSVCDSNTEQYLPITVDIVLNNPEVSLRNSDGDVVKVAPSAQDLANLPAGYYLDYPGTPRDPGCTYAKWFQKIKGDNPPSTYAHVINDGEGHIVVQYWFFYVFNNFNDTHESDWEMMQITFDANSVEEALQIEPTSVALAQHAGGETSDWGSVKLEMKDGHPVTHSASGSHADYYADDIYLGWGDNGTGFGCDITTPPSHVILLKAILVPDNPTRPGHLPGRPSADVGEKSNRPSSMDPRVPISTSNGTSRWNGKMACGIPRSPFQPPKHRDPIPGRFFAPSQSTAPGR